MTNYFKFQISTNNQNPKHDCLMFWFVIWNLFGICNFGFDAFYLILVIDNRYRAGPALAVV